MLARRLLISGGGGSFVPPGATQPSGADFPSQPTDDDIPF